MKENDLKVCTTLVQAAVDKTAKLSHTLSMTETNLIESFALLAFPKKFSQISSRDGHLLAQADIVSPGSIQLAGGVGNLSGPFAHLIGNTSLWGAGQFAAAPCFLGRGVV